MVQLDSILVAEVLEALQNELWAIVGDQFFGYAESGDDIPHYEIHQCVGFNDGVSFRPCPLCEVIHGGEDEGYHLCFPIHIFYGTNNVKGPHQKWPG